MSTKSTNLVILTISQILLWALIATRGDAQGTPDGDPPGGMAGAVETVFGGNPLAEHVGVGFDHRLDRYWLRREMWPLQ